MATDARRIVYDPTFVNSLQPAELEAVLAHEVLHCALGHHCRRGRRDPRPWNEAADLAINPLLVERSGQEHQWKLRQYVTGDKGRHINAVLLRLYRLSPDGSLSKSDFTVCAGPQSDRDAFSSAAR
jgi:hypothetical protein